MNPIRIPDDELRKAQTLLASIQHLVNIPRLHEAAVIEVARDIGKSPRTVRRYVAKCLRNPTAEAFVSQKYLNINRPPVPRISAQSEKIIQDCIVEFYIGRQEKISALKLHEIVNGKCREASEDDVSYSTVYRRLAVVKEGEKAKAKKISTHPDQFKYKPGKLTTDIPLEHVQIDHTKVDKMLDLRLFGLGVRRPWLTLAIDIATRCIYGYYLSLIRPNIEACALTMLMGYTPKNLVLKQMGFSLEDFAGQGIDEPWPIYGPCQNLGHDGAREFISSRFQDGLRNLGNLPLKRPPDKTHYGGHIERLIGRFMADVHMLPGTTFSNSVEKGEYASHKHAGMTIEEFEQWLIMNILRYHLKVHTDLGCSPYSQYQLLKDNIAKRRTADLDLARVRREFMCSKPLVVHSAGIQLKHRWYQSGALRPFIGQRVMARWATNDLSKLYVSLDMISSEIVVPLAPWETQTKHWDIWDKTTPRKGRVMEDSRQTDLAYKLLMAMDDLGQKTKRLKPIKHEPSLPLHSNSTKLHDDTTSADLVTLNRQISSRLWIKE